jgi:UDP-N-acetylmuramate: L-alanyl-gamma-D-glutamyl-meso-diaminopimelate ligase
MAVLELRSNSMKQGAHRELLPDALRAADYVWVYHSDDIQWSLEETLKGMDSVRILDSVDNIVTDVVATGQAGDVVVVMSNGDFQGIHAKLRDALQRKASGRV